MKIMKMKKTKKILAVLMSMIVIMGVCGVGTGCDPNKETEAEYKARIKKELDEIPVEATGYKLVSCGTEEEKKYKSIYYGHVGGIISSQEDIDEHRYNLTFYGKCKTNEEGFGFKIAIDEGEEKWISFNYSEKFKNFGWVWEIAFFDNQIFIIRANVIHRFWGQLTDHAPSTLFIYDYESNTMKYLGYNTTWFDNPIYDNNNTKTIIQKEI